MAEDIEEEGFEDNDFEDDDDDLEDDIDEADDEADGAADKVVDDSDDDDDKKESDDNADDDDDVLDLEEDLHPDDVEAPLDALLAERIAAGGLDDDDDDIIDDRGRTKVVPRRDTEFHCSSCFLVLPNHMLANKKKMLCRDCS